MSLKAIKKLLQEHACKYNATAGAGLDFKHVYYYTADGRSKVACGANYNAVLRVLKNRLACA